MDLATVVFGAMLSATSSKLGERAKSIDCIVTLYRNMLISER